MIQNNTRMTKTNIQFNKIFNTAVFGVIFLAAMQNPVYSAEDTSKAFNLMTVVDNFLNLDGDTKSAYETLDEKTRHRQEFVETTRRFNQGNVSVAYNDYLKIITEIDSDIALLMFSKSMYEIGFFTLGDVAISKIKNQSYFALQIENLKKSYKDTFALDKQEEIYLAKAYASIYFDNTPEETAFDLSKKTGLMEKSDYANYVMAQALLESRQYQQALMFIENAIAKNPKNPAYLTYKINIMDKSGKHKEALKLLEKYENSDIITPEFKIKILVQKEDILANLSANENEKKFHQININYINGNYYKVINECQNILNFNKNNYKILTLQGKSLLNVGKTDLAKKVFLQSFNINKGYSETLLGLGDISYIEGDFKKSAEYYKKALKGDKNNTVIMTKLFIVYKNIPSSEKTLANLEKQLKAIKTNFFYENYIAAASMLKNNQTLRKEYLLKSLNGNLMFENARNEYLAYLNENKKQKGLQNFLYIVSFVNNFDYTYYYYRSIVENILGNRDIALNNVKHCVSLNPDFEPAGKLMLELEGSLI